MIGDKIRECITNFIRARKGNEGKPTSMVLNNLPQTYHLRELKCSFEVIHSHSNLSLSHGQRERYTGKDIEYNVEETSELEFAAKGKASIVAKKNH